MATFTKGLLSGTLADDGQAFSVTTSHDTFHTGPSVATSYDEVWVYAANADSTDHEIIVGWGDSGGTDTAHQIRLTITASTGSVLVIPGLILKGNATTAPVVTAMCTTAGKVNLTGYVNHITA